MKQAHKTIALWIVIVLVVLAVVHIMNQPIHTAEQVGFSEFLAAVESNNIESVKLVTANGESRTLQDDDLDLVVEAEGVTGMITEVMVKTRTAAGKIVAAVTPSAVEILSGDSGATLTAYSPPE